MPPFGGRREQTLPPTRRIPVLSPFLPLILAIATVSCATDDEPPSAAQPSESAGSKLEDVEQKSAEVRRAIRDYAYAEKADLIAEVKKDLSAIETEMDRLSAKVDSSKGEAKADAKAKLEGVRTKWAEAKERLDDADDASDAEWEDVKRNVERSYGELQDSFDDARQRLSDEIAPP